MIEQIIELQFCNISGATRNTPIKVKPRFNGVEYFPIEELSKIAKISTRQIGRYLTKFEKEREPWRYIMNIGGKIFISQGLIYMARRKKNNITNLTKKQYEQWLSTYTWDNAVTVSFENKFSVQSLRKMMENYKKKMIEKSEVDINIFYAVEQNPGRDGYHIHYIERNFSKKSKEELRNNTRIYFKNYSPVSLLNESYDSNDGYIGYILKYIHRSAENYEMLL